MNNLKTIMLVDDNPDDNFIHERVIHKIKPEFVVIPMNSGPTALEYLKSKKDPHPELIFLDINMPGMNGWEFLFEYDKLDDELKSRVVVTMLTTSQNPDDELRAKTWGFISSYITKPLTKEIMQGIIDKSFK